MTHPDTIAKIRTALADPAAPWYGSDLVPLVADLLDDYRKRQPELLDCPFCGEAASVEWSGDGHERYFTIGCSTESCRGGHPISAEPECNLISGKLAWNHRLYKRA